MDELVVDNKIFEENTVDVKPKSVRVSDLMFATAMKTCGSILLNRKKAAQLKRIKKKAVQKIIRYVSLQGVVLTEDQVYKKINNMKSRIKSKTEASHNISSLNCGEKIFFELMATVEHTKIIEPGK